MKKSKFQEKSGITMIVLIIIVVVLLILAGISIAALTGENGILNRATEARYQTELKEAKEEVMEQWYSVVKRYIKNEKTAYNYEIMAKALQEKLKEADKDATAEYKEGNNTIEVHYKGFDIEIQADDEVTTNRMTAKKNIKDAWDKVKDNSNSIEDLARELDIDSSKIRKDEDGNVKIDGYLDYNETITDDDITVEAPEPAEKPKITITHQPEDVTVTERENAQFSVTANIKGTPTYKWYKHTRQSSTGGTLITGADSDTLTITSASIDDDLYYYCEISSTLNGKTEKIRTVPAHLKVNRFIKIPLEISSQPRSTETTVGQSAEVKVEVEGNGTLSYQWYKNDTNSNEGGTKIDGETESTLKLNDTTIDDDGYYYCEVKQVFDFDGTEETVKTNPYSISSKDSTHFHNTRRILK